MKRSVGRLFATVLATTLVLFPALSAQAGRLRPEVPMSPAFARDLATLPGSGIWDGFVHFKSGTQASHKTLLTAHGLSVVRDYEAVDAVYAVGTINAFRSIRREASLSYLEDNAKLTFSGETSKFATRVESAQKAIDGGPYRDSLGNILNGNNIGIAVVDSGIDGTHPDLAGSIARNFKIICSTPGLINNGSGDPNQEGKCFGTGDPSGAEFQEVPDSDTSSGHGTHVAGIVAGGGQASQGVFKGVAPGAKLYGFGSGETISILFATDAFWWIYENGYLQTPPIRVVTNSWGCSGGCAFNPTNIISKLTNKLVNERNTTVLFAAGNDFGNGTTDKLSGYGKNPLPGVLAVANYNDAGSGTKNNTLDTSSSRGLSGNAATYPDISAPGSSITSTCTQSKAVCDTGVSAAYPPSYSVLSGTSMATPHTAGAVALLLQANPSLTPAQIETTLELTAYKFTGGTSAPGLYNTTDTRNPATGTNLTSFDKGHGLIDVVAAAASQGAVGDGYSGTPSVTITSPSAGSTQSGNITVSGNAFDASTGGSNNQTQASGDGGDYSGAGALDLVGLSSTETTSGGLAGIEFKIAVRDAADVPPSASLRIAQNINGRFSWTNATLVAGPTVTPNSTYNAGNNSSIATSASISGNDIILFVPFTRICPAPAPANTECGLGNPGTNSIGHNTYAATFTGVIQDKAPGGLGAEVNSAPLFAAPWHIKPAATVTPSAQVKLSVDGGAETSATLGGASPDYTWTANADLTGLSGAHTITSRLYLNGVLRATNSVSINVPLALLPDAPGSLTATRADGSIALGWTAAADNGYAVTAYKVYRTVGAGSEALLATLGNVTAHNDLGLVNGTSYSYRVSAVNVGGEGPLSAAAAAVPAGLPTVPGSLTKTLVSNGVKLNWAASTGNGAAITGYKIYRDGTLLATTGTVLTYTDTTGSHGTTYSYRVSSLNDVGESALSNTVSATFDLLAPDAPVIVAPAQNALSKANTTFSGTAEAGSTVRIYEGTSLLTSKVASSTGSWSASKALGNGIHNVVATATDALGHVSVASAVRTFDVDGQGPYGQITTRSPSLFTLQALIEGSSTDNRGVTKLSLSFTNGITGAIWNELVDCFPECPTTSTYFAHWTSALPRGFYNVRLHSYDAAGNEGISPAIAIFKVG